MNKFNIGDRVYHLYRPYVGEITSIQKNSTGIAYGIDLGRMEIYEENIFRTKGELLDSINCLIDDRERLLNEENRG